MENFEYIKWYWNYIDDEMPVVLFYEIDLENERYATRMTEIFASKKAAPVIENGFQFITEAPVPTIDEINKNPLFFAEIIPKDEFEEVYFSSVYLGSIEFCK